ncbi:MULTISPECIES: UDP-glucose 4-epimerase family protein [unclassified Pseudomonas]|uniref:UDP-glucose 4-epimerase family protein n=1 Tax=unclassified Pseudomonas TaxID=196821 RepID=UPI000CD18606|nr:MULTISPECIES: SDR family oxidoreductase [unclassified Pseudomonas]POA55737.1 NAD-dependent dehydratase [Pseudomonas sp. FW507-12TSA]
MAKILLTGASGFLGRSIIDQFSRSTDFQLAAVFRQPPVELPGTVALCQVTEIIGTTDWNSFLPGCSVVIHAAARVHVMNETSSDPLTEFRRVNVEGTLNLARQAASAGVRRFIFISSIKVNGEGTATAAPYFADAQPMPLDHYGISKMEAEQGLLKIAEQTGLEVVIIRPPLVYGPGVKANFLAMMRWLQKGVPLPFGAIGNKRSLVALGNLVDLIRVCIEHPAAANQIFLVSDGEDLSTTELLRRMARALKVPVRLIPVPVWILSGGAALLGKKSLSHRLCGSLQVDISKTQKLLGWTPPITVDSALNETAKYFLTLRD